MESKIWAILWPALKFLWEELFELEDQAILVVIFILSYMVTVRIINSFKPQYKRGSFISEIVHVYVSVTIFLVPLVAVLFWLSKEYPLLEDVFSFISKEFDLQERGISWMKVFFIAVVFLAAQRLVISKLSLVLQKLLINFPLGEFLMAFVLVAEGLLYFASAVFMPMNMIVLAQEAEIILVEKNDETPKPPGVEISQEIWDAISTGVERAKVNGVNCNPYLMLSIKMYETWTNICTPEDEGLPRPNKCASYAGALGIMQFLPETFQRNAKRHGVTGSLWDPPIAVEVACYFTVEEVNISLDQPIEEFIEEFSSKDLVWNADPSGAETVYNRAKKFERWAEESQEPEEPEPEDPPSPSPNPSPSPSPSPEPPPEKVDGYLWPAPKKSYVSFAWGVPMSYGSNHNGIDIVLLGFPPFKVVALADGKARYWNGGACNAGVIDLQLKNGETFQYVHMSLKKGEIEIPTNGSWVSVEQGQVLGWIHNGTTSCSDGPHLHLMRMNKTWIGAKEFIRK